MFATFNSEAHLSKSFPVFLALTFPFAFKVCKMCSILKKVSSKMHMHIKPHNLISNPKKLQNTQAKKLSTKKWEKNRVFDFYYCVQKFSVCNFLGVNFLTFFQRIRTQHRILRFRIQISNFCKTKYIFLKVALFANCKVRRGRNKAKKLKTYFL